MSLLVGDSTPKIFFKLGSSLEKLLKKITCWGIWAAGVWGNDVLELKTPRTDSGRTHAMWIDLSTPKNRDNRLA
jgi:hypothetical protein